MDPVAAFEAAVHELGELCSDISYACDYGREESLPELRLLWEAAARRAWLLYPAALDELRSGRRPCDPGFPTDFQQQEA